MAKQIVVDCEGSGPCPGHGSLICFGAVPIEREISGGYRSKVIRPEDENFDPQAYGSIGLTREEHQRQAEVTLAEAFVDFHKWLQSLGGNRFMLWSDNPAYDWQWINHGFAAAGIRNPFGYSARRIGDLYAGLQRNPGDTNGWKELRKTVHDHDPLNDAIGNAEAVIAILDKHDVLDWLR